MSGIRVTSESIVMLGAMAFGQMASADGVVGIRGESRNGGAYVLEVTPGSPAEAGGLLGGDVITSVDGQAVRRFEDFTAVVGRKRPGDDINVEVSNPSEKLSLSMKVAARGSTFKPFQLSADELEALAELKDVDGEAEHDRRTPGKRVTGVTVMMSRINARTFKYFRAFRALRTLTITTSQNDSEPTLESLHGIADIHQLLELRLTGPKVTDDVLAACGPLKDLRRLRLEQTKITDASLERIGAAHSDWTLLSFKDSPITDEGLGRLSQCQSLEFLDVSATRVTGSGLLHLAGMPRLRVIDLASSMLQAEHVAHLARLTSLESLGVSNTAITDGELVHLSKLTNLKFLGLNNTGSLSEEGQPYPGGIAGGVVGSRYAEIVPQGGSRARSRADGVTCEGVVSQLAGLSNLTELQIAGPECLPGEVRDMAKIWPKATIRTSIKTIVPELSQRP